jgi:hypothetical protein
LDRFFFEPTETVTTKLKVVSIDPSPIIPQIKSCFARIRCPRITIRHEHLRQRQTIKQAPLVITDIVQSQPFSVVEPNSKAPLLPGYLLALNTERRTFRLHHLVWLRGGPRARSEVGMILAGSSGMYPFEVEWALLVTYAFVWR